MEEKKLKAMFFNGSPRKNKNTADMLQSAMRGAETAGAETELVHLYDIDFKGCKSCFACKLKNSKCNGICALKDDLRPVLERARQADILVLGSPVYYSYPTGVIRAFMERLCFPVGTYMYEREEGESDGHLGRHITLRDKVIPTAMILTMNCPEDYMKVIGYPAILDENAKVMEDIFGYSETLYVCNTYQFNDYSRYDFNLFSEEDKRKYRDEHYHIDLKNAYELGIRLVEKCREGCEQTDKSEFTIMTELEKCMAGEWYDCHSPEFIEAKARASEWCARYNATPYSQRSERRKMLEELFGAVGSNVSVGDNFTCGFGTNIYIGSNVSVNLNCTFIDCNRITIGNDVLIAPCVHLTTATHPVELSDRLTPNWDSESGEYRWRTYTKPITIGNGCWIGANVVVLPGVTIGDGTVIGAGSVVTKDIPSNVVAVGNPCRVVRKINK